MIDLDVIETEIDNTIRHYGGVALMQCSYVKELITRIRQAEKDAARYRWLRDEADGFQLDGCMQLCGEDWDLAIDKVIQCSK